MPAIAKRKVTHEDLDVEIEQACHAVIEGRPALSRVTALQDIEASILELSMERLYSVTKDEIINTVTEAYDFIFKVAKKT